MGFATGQPVPWPVPPDWADGMRQRLEFLTDVMAARNGRRQKRSLRLAPRRTLEFDVIADNQLHRVLDAVLMDASGGEWMLPVWPDVQLITTAVSAGAGAITCSTVGRDFVAGGSALLWAAVNAWEIVTIDSVSSGALTLDGVAASAWPSGTRLYPLRRARIFEQPSETMWSDAASTRNVQLQIVEPCDWTAVAPTTTYRGYPVFDWRPDESEDPKAEFRRQLETIDPQTGAIAVFDDPLRSFRAANFRIVATTRAEYAALLSLLYWLAGRWRSLWIPTWNADLQLAADVTSVATTISVEWCGYTVFGRMQSNWRDIRIELFDGTVFYRRITSAAEAGNAEILGIDSALGVAVARSAVRVISFMVFGAHQSDVFELRHETDADGVTFCELSFEAERNDV